MTFSFKPIAAFLYACSVAILLSAGVLVYLLLSPVDVLRNWHIFVTGSTHYPGETVAVDSHYEKVRNVTGQAFRYLDCKNERGAYTRWAISSASANNESGARRSTGILVTIPSNIMTPTTCHISILVKYQVNPLRTQPEFTTSNEFNLVTKPGDSTAVIPVVTQVVSHTVVHNSSATTKTATPSPAPTTNSTSTTNTTNNTTTNTPAQPEQAGQCVLSVLGLNIGCN